MTITPVVSIVIPCRDEAHTIEAVIDSIRTQDLEGLSIEVLIADGGSTDGTCEILAAVAARDPRVRVLHNAAGAVAAGLNQCIRASAGDVILRMDAHTKYASDYVRRCVEELHATGAGNVGGPWVAHGDTPVARAIAAAFQSPVGTGGALSHDIHYRGAIDSPYLGCWPRRIFDEGHWFDEALVRNQDDEHNIRLRRAGHVVWQSPEIHSTYRVRKTFRAFFLQYLQYGYWKVAVIRKHRSVAAWRHLAPAAWMLTLVALAAAAFVDARAAVVLAAALAAYGLAIALGARAAAAQSEGTSWILTGVAIATCHVGYGAGFTFAIIDVIVGRKPSPLFVRSSRPAAANRYCESRVETSPLDHPRAR